MHVFLPGTGERVYQRNLFSNRTLTAASFGERRGDAVFGFENGQIQRGDITFQTQYLTQSDMPDEYRDMRIGESRAYEEGVVFLTPRNQFRYRYVNVAFQDATEMDDPSPIRHLSHTVRSSGPAVVSYTDNGRLFMSSIRERRNLLTGDVRIDLDERRLPYTLPEGRDAPNHLQIVGLGDNIFVMWKDGLLLRYDIRDRDNPRVVETLDLVPEEGESLTATGFMIGRHSLVTGDSLGRTRVWFRISARDVERAAETGVVEEMKEPDPDELVEVAKEAGEDDQIEGDGLRMVNAHELKGPPGGLAVTSLGRSLRSRLMSVGYSDGTVRLFQVTANNLVLESELEGAQPVEQLTMAPRDNAIIASSAAGICHWHIDVGHAAITPQSIFLPVWYEDYAGPQHMWQSSAAMDDFEPKYGLVPLIFGTLKATVYAMLFALPLALLATVYSSEFLRSGFITP